LLGDTADNQSHRVGECDAMELAQFELLLTSTGQAALASAVELSPSEDSFLPDFNRLQRHFPAALAKTALDTVLLRTRAASKFSRAASMYFTREALEQASGETIARHRAERFAGFGRVGDFCCGIGGDTIGLAGRGEVTAVDLDGLRLAMAEQNVAAYGLNERVQFVRDDLLLMPPPSVEAIFFDPARRSGGRRRLAVSDYQPPLDTIRRWLPHVPAVGVKLAPGVDRADLSGYDAEVEFLSVDGELKECVLWFGPLRTTARRATLLPGRHTLSTHGPVPASSLSPPLAYLHDPDPAVLRAGLVTLLAEQLGARQLDPDIAYLTSDTPRRTPFAESFRIEEALPFQLKRLRERLRALRVGRVTVKRRGSALDPDVLVRQLRLSGPESRVLFLTRVAGRPWVLIATGLGPEDPLSEDRRHEAGGSHDAAVRTPLN
jgi:hypothetical protein